MDELKKNTQAIHDILHRIKLADVMRAPVETVDQYEDFSAVEEIFAQKKIHHLPVVDDSKKIIGIISQKDVYRHISPRRSPDGQIVYRKDIIIDEDGYYEKNSLNQYILKYVMNRNPQVLTQDKSLGDAVHLMSLHKIGCVPVVDKDRRVIGIITRVDFLRLADNVLPKHP